MNELCLRPLCGSRYTVGNQTTEHCFQSTIHGTDVPSVSAAIARGKRPVTFRTRKLRLAAPMVLQGGPCGRVGHRRTPIEKRPPIHLGGLFAFNPPFSGRARNRGWAGGGSRGGRLCGRRASIHVRWIAREFAQSWEASQSNRPCNDQHRPCSGVIESSYVQCAPNPVWSSDHNAKEHECFCAARIIHRA